MPTTTYALNSRERGTEGKATIQIREASSATFKSGEIVGVSAAGQVKQLPAGTVDTTTAECANGLVRALRDASGTANTLIDCELFDDTSRVNIPISNGGAVVASNANMVGDKTAGYVTAAGANFIDAQLSADTNNTTNPLFRIVKFDKKEAIGTASSIHFALCSVIQGARFGG